MLEVDDYLAGLGSDNEGARQGSTVMSAIDEQLGSMMGDAPFCDQCGHVTIRNGSCYKCLNCGSSMGCS